MPDFFKAWLEGLPGDLQAKLYDWVNKDSLPVMPDPMWDILITIDNHRNQS